MTKQLDFMNNEIFKDFDIELYKLINTDLSFTTDTEYYNHYYNHGKEENRIKSQKDFSLAYPKIDIVEYQELNYDLKLHNKNEIMAHYHNNGKNEDRILSRKDFNKNILILILKYINYLIKI